MERYRSSQNPIVVTPAVFEGLGLIRRSGGCNMFDLTCVLQLAEHFGQEATAIWIRARRDDYAKGLIAGFRMAEVSDKEGV
jgi:hypothetical protein